MLLTDYYSALLVSTYVFYERPWFVTGQLHFGWGTTVVQFAFLLFVACVNFMAGIGAAMYLGKAPRDLRFVTQLLHALRHYRLFQRGDSAELGPPSGSDPAHTESPADAAKAVDLDHDVSSTSRDDVSPVQIGLEERIIDMAAQEVHLRQIGRRLSDDRAMDPTGILCCLTSMKTFKSY